MGIISESVVPAKFISCITHVLMMISLYWTFEQNVRSGLASDATSSDKTSARASILICVTISLLMQGFEIINLFIGLSLFSDAFNMIQIVFHLLGTVITSWFVLEDWKYSGIWGIWFFTIFFPFFLEVLIMIKAKTSYQT